MKQYTESAPLSQVKSPLTKKQKATIDRLMVKYPTITRASVRYHYEHYHYARNWFVWIEIEPTAYHNMIEITRCDHAPKAAEKAMAIKEYIASKLGGQS